MVWKGRETALGFALASHWGALGDILNISVKYSSLSKDKRSAEPSPFERILKDESVGVNDPEFPADSIWAFTGHYFKWFWDVISLDATILSDNYCRFILVFRRSSLTNGSLITTKYPVHYPAWIPLFFFFIQTNQHLKKKWDLLIILHKYCQHFCISHYPLISKPSLFFHGITSPVSVLVLWSVTSMFICLSLSAIIRTVVLWEDLRDCWLLWEYFFVSWTLWV